MQRYVVQLINQFKACAKTRRDAHAAAASQEKSPSVELTENISGEDKADEDFEAYIQEVEAFVEGPRVNSPTLAQLVGIPKDELPVASALTEDELLGLIEAMQELLFTYGHVFNSVARDGCPPEKFYAYILAGLDEPGIEMNIGRSLHDCGTNPPTCPFDEYCTCAEHYTQAEYKEAGGTADIPPEYFMSEEDRALEDAEYAAFVADEDAHLPNELNDEPGTYEVPHINTLMHPDNVGLFDPGHIVGELEHIQIIVDHYIKTHGVRYFSELTNTAILAEEVGEVARLAARRFGDQSFKREADSASAKTDWADELSDVLFVITCLANQTGVNLTDAFAMGMAKRTNRDADRHKGNKKL